MSTARNDATATLLPNGLVLVAGGTCCGDSSAQLSSAELYDPATGTWTPTGSMNVARSGQTATLLPDGDVLVAGGGCNGHAYGCDSGSFLTTLRSAELYHPDTGSWSLTASMKEGRQSFSATLLGNGKVLVAGGFNSCDDDFCSDLASAELYDPSSGTWETTGSMHGPREQQTATRLLDGQVLVAGGIDEGGSGKGRPYADAELYDPSTGSWTETAPMPQPHYGDTATLLANGWVLVAGGQSADAALYQPQSAIWVPTGTMSTPRTDQTATLLPQGHVLVTGGTGPDGQAQTTAELYLAGPGPLVTVNPDTLALGAQQVGTIGTAQNYTVTNDGSATLKVSGITISGADPGDFMAHSGCDAGPLPPGGTCSVSVRLAPTTVGLRTASVAVADNAPLSPQAVAVSGYGSGPGGWSPTGSMPTARQHFTATLLPDGAVLVAGGEDGTFDSLSGADLYDPTTGTFSPTGSLNQARAYATATLLPDGEVLVAGGIGPGPTALSSAELYDPATGAWTLTGAMDNSGSNLSSALLPSGEVLVEGFVTGSGAEVYDPTLGTWSDTGPVGGPGYFSTVTVLSDGDVLAAGGITTAAALFDPSTNAWSATGPMVAAQEDPTATALPDGDVLVAGGEAPNDVPLSTSELYDPTTGTWALTSDPMHFPRDGQTATLLTSGLVMVTGGCVVECDARKLTATTELYDPSGGFWFTAEPMTEARYGDSATLLDDGDVLVAGGGDYCCQAYASAEVYTPTVLFADPTSGPVGQQVMLTGGGFFAHEDVAITWDGRPLARPRTSGQGTLAVTITVPSASVGTHSIGARGSRSFATAEVAFRVTA
jgi:N-acetylneuraminic acid mutarotase